MSNSSAVVGLVGIATVFGIVSSAICLRYDRVGQNEIAIQTRNGVITADNLQPGLQWNWSLFDAVDYPRVSTTTQSFSITAVDKGQHCDKDCVTLQTNDQQTVTGSLGIQWHIERKFDGRESVMAELYNLRGATTTSDIQEKFLVPHFIDCMISTINKNNAGALVDKGKEVVDDIKNCAKPRVTPYHIVIEEVFDRGFGPSAEARQSMKRFADARQDGQVADIQMQTAEKRKQAALKNSDIFSAIVDTFVKQGLSKDQAITAACLTDSNSKERPCVPYTAMGGNVGANFVPAMNAPVPSLH